MPPDSRPHTGPPPDQQTPNSFHPPPAPPGPHVPPHFHNNGPGMIPPPGNEFYNNFNQQGFPPGPAPIHNPDWNTPAQGGYYGDYGPGAPPIRRGVRGGYRGRGRGFSHGFGKGLCTCIYCMHIYIYRHCLYNHIYKLQIIFISP